MFAPRRRMETDGRLSGERAVVCASVATYPDSLTRGREYTVLAEEDRGGVPHLKISDNRGRTRWYRKDIFAPTGTTVPLLERWELDDERNGIAEVNLYLSDGAKRWCLLYTPIAVADWMSRNPDERSLRGAHVIVVRSLNPATIDSALREIDSLGELAEHSLPIGDGDPAAA